MKGQYNVAQILLLILFSAGICGVLYFFGWIFVDGILFFHFITPGKSPGYSGFMLDALFLIILFLSPREKRNIVLLVASLFPLLIFGLYVSLLIF